MDRIQVNLRGLPSHVLEAVCRPDTALNTRSTESMISPLTFPKSKIHLWDPTPNGDLVNLHLSWYRKPRLLLMEKALRLAHRHARQSKKPQFSCFLLGTLAVESDEEGVAITLDRFDPGRDQPNGLAKSPTALLPGDVLVPCLFDIQHVSNATVYSARDLDITFKLLEQSCTNREAMEIWKVMSLRVRLSCVENMDRLSFTLHWAGVTLANSLEAVPVRVLPIIPTALARNLSSSASMAQPVHSHTNVKKRGFLTMDQTRKLLLILESDPKAYTLPLVGVWLSGVTHIHNPVVWAWCLRYLYSSSLCDKVMSEDDAFLVVLYSLTHRDPEFYQCKRHGSKDMSFQLISSTESLTLYKNVEPAEGRLLPFELGTEIQNQEAELFQEALSSSALSRAGATSSVAVQNKLSISDHDSGVEDEDLSPRPSPNPHPINHQIKQVQPSVPELSMVLDSSFLDGMVGKSHQHTPMHSVQSSPHLWNSSSSTPLTRTAPQPPAQSVMTGPPPIRRPLTPVLSQSKSNRTQSTIGNQPSICRKSIPSMERRSSNGFSVSQSSSSSSSPKTGLSPSDSIHEHAHKSHHPKPPPPNQKSKKLSINRDQTLPPPPSQQVVFHSTPVFSPTCSCCPSHYSHIPVYHGNNTWQGTSSPAVQNHVACPPEGSPHQDCCLSPTRPTLSLGSNTAQSPMCHAVVPLHCSLSQGSHFPNPCGGALDQTTPVHLAQCCQLQPDPAAITSPDSGMRLLQADAYRMLMEQDRQLKQLQAQIQKLLDAQNKVSEPPQASPEKQQEQAIQTSPFPEPLKKTGVSIAVGTGASLFWSSPSQSSVHERQSVECHSDANSAGSSRLDSKKVYQSREEPSPEASQHSTSPQHNTLDVGVSFQSPVFEQSASIYSVSQTHDTEESSQNGEIPDERFYQELLGQVQNRLQDKIIEEQMEQDVQSPGPRHSMTPRTTPPNKPVLRQHNAKGTEEDRVFSATLKQLQSLGVNMELSTGQSTRSTVESASTLACINPDAVIPRLTLSEPVGTSIWGLSGGVDLSLEANAIALKYLSDSQLSRLSMGSQSTGARSNPSALLLGKAALENNSTGLSILSSSNMSLATCKYMKKYGLMESGGSEEEEDDTGETIQRTQADSALGCSMQLNVSENVEREKQTGLILKNVSNKQPDRLLSSGESQSQLIRDLRPKMQLLVKSKNGSEKENTPEHVVPQPRPQRRSSLSDNQRCASVPETQGSVGNFLDLSRLRQLPKLFKP